MRTSPSRRGGGVILVLFGWALLGNDTALPGLATIAKSAYGIGVGRLVESEAIEYSIGSEARICGHVFRAEVRDSIKGPATGERIDFFSPHYEPALEAGALILFVVSERSESARDHQLRLLEAMPPGEARERFACVLRAGKYTALTSPELMLLPALSEADASPGAPWFPRRKLSLLARPDFEAQQIGGQASVSWAAITRAFRRAAGDTTQIKE